MKKQSKKNRKNKQVCKNLKDQHKDNSYNSLSAYFTEIGFYIGNIAKS